MVFITQLIYLKTGQEAIEERARSELGMVKNDEVFYQVIDTNGLTDAGVAEHSTESGNLIAIVPSGADAKLEVPDTVLFESDIPYSSPGGERLALDMARPKNAAGPLPAVALSSTLKPVK